MSYKLLLLSLLISCLITAIRLLRKHQPKVSALRAYFSLLAVGMSATILITHGNIDPKDNMRALEALSEPETLIHNWMGLFLFYLFVSAALISDITFFAIQSAYRLNINKKDTTS